MSAHAHLGAVRSWAMVPTPFSRSGDEIDHESLAHVVDWTLRQGCQGFVVLGAIAEPTTLSVREQQAVVRTVSRAAPGIPLIAMLPTLDPERHATAAQDLSHGTGRLLDAFMMPVVSDDVPTQREAQRRVHEICGLPLVVQDLPRASGVHVDVRALGRAVVDSAVIAVKAEALPTSERIARLRGDAPEVTVWTGLGGAHLPDDVRAGATAVAIGTTAAGTVVEAMRHAQEGDLSAAHGVLEPWLPRIRFETQPVVSVAVRKEVWRREGVIAHATVRPPTASLPAEVIARLDDLLEAGPRA